MDIKHRLTFDDRISEEVAQEVFHHYPQLKRQLTRLLIQQENWQEDVATPTSRLKLLIEQEDRRDPPRRYENKQVIDSYMPEIRQYRLAQEQNKRQEARKTAFGYAAFMFFISLAMTTHLVGLGSIPLGAVAAIVMYQVIYNMEKPK